MAGPLCILYEVGIISARLAVRKRKTPAPPVETAAP
jgi:Sec-independent protein secretion pathway component TatC